MASPGRGRAIAFGILIAVLSLPAGYVILVALTAVIDWLWTTVPESASDPVLWALVLGVPTIAGVGVALLRQHGSDGHNPMFGIALNPIKGREYPSIIGAIIFTLAGGLALGPEVAMVSTGAVIGTSLAARSGIEVKKAATIGAAAAILALFVGPVINGSFTVTPDYSFSPKDLVGAIGVSALTALVLTLGRFLSIGILRLHGGDRPRIFVLALVGFLVGAVALTYHLTTGHAVNLVMTSGESNTKEMLLLGTTSAIGITVAAKWLAYSLSMGGGFRGGPFFPAIYIGAGIAAMATLAMPDYAQGSLAAGITAAIVYLAHPKWIATLVIGAGLGLLTGGPAVVPLALAAAAVAKVLPGVRDSTSPTGAEQVTEVR